MLSPRSVVLVTIDTLRADALGIYGNRLGVTPRLDRVGREGVVFEQANAASPNTLPSHVSILTGKWPFHHGVRSNDGYALADDQVTLAERVGEKGFATAAEVASIVLARETGVGQGFASFRDTRSPGVARVETPIEMREAADITDSGIRFLEQNRTGPFPSGSTTTIRTIPTPRRIVFGCAPTTRAGPTSLRSPRTGRCVGAPIKARWPTSTSRSLAV